MFYGLFLARLHYLIEWLDPASSGHQSLGTAHSHISYNFQDLNSGHEAQTLTHVRKEVKEDLGKGIVLEGRKSGLEAKVCM